MTTLKELFEKAEADEAFWVENHQKFLALYPDKFVAACGEEVVAVSDDPLRLRELIEEMQLDLRQLRVSFINTQLGNLIV